MKGFKSPEEIQIYLKPNWYGKIYFQGKAYHPTEKLRQYLLNVDKDNTNTFLESLGFYELRNAPEDGDDQLKFYLIHGGEFSHFEALDKIPQVEISNVNALSTFNVTLTKGIIKKYQLNRKPGATLKLAAASAHVSDVFNLLFNFGQIPMNDAQDIDPLMDLENYEVFNMLNDFLSGGLIVKDQHGNIFNALSEPVLPGESYQLELDETKSVSNRHLEEKFSKAIYDSLVLERKEISKDFQLLYPKKGIAGQEISLSITTDDLIPPVLHLGVNDWQRLPEEMLRDFKEFKIINDGSGAMEVPFTRNANNDGYELNFQIPKKGVKEINFVIKRHDKLWFKNDDKDFKIIVEYPSALLRNNVMDALRNDKAMFNEEDIDARITTILSKINKREMLPKANEMLTDDGYVNWLSAVSKLVQGQRHNQENTTVYYYGPGGGANPMSPMPIDILSPLILSDFDQLVGFDIESGFFDDFQKMVEDELVGIIVEKKENIKFEKIISAEKKEAIVSGQVNKEKSDLEDTFIAKFEYENKSREVRITYKRNGMHAYPEEDYDVIYSRAEGNFLRHMEPDFQKNLMKKLPSGGKGFVIIQNKIEKEAIELGSEFHQIEPGVSMAWNDDSRIPTTFDIWVKDDSERELKDEELTKFISAKNLWLKSLQPHTEKVVELVQILEDPFQKQFLKQGEIKIMPEQEDIKSMVFELSKSAKIIFDTTKNLQNIPELKSLSNTLNNSDGSVGEDTIFNLPNKMGPIWTTATSIFNGGIFTQDFLDIWRDSLNSLMELMDLLSNIQTKVIVNTVNLQSLGVHETVKIRESADKSMLINKGGIDLNANTLPLDVQGGEIDLNFPMLSAVCIDEDHDGSCERMNIQALENMPITGFTPVIFQIIPITNLNPLLGIADDESPFDSAQDNNEGQDLTFIDKYRKTYFRKWQQEQSDPLQNPYKLVTTL